jgi:chromosome partitioning protein
VLDLEGAAEQSVSVTTPDEELAERGRAIFDRLRTSPEPEPAGDAPVEAAEHAPQADEPAEPAAGDPAVLDVGGGPAVEPNDPEPPSEPVASDEPLLVQPIPEQPALGLADDGTAPPELEPASVTSEEDAAEPPGTVPAAPETVEADEAPVGESEEEPNAFARPLPRILAIANQKGGVGKTTTAVNLGAALAELGYRVLVVDLDPQGNATTGLGVNPRNLETSVYDVIMHDSPLEDCIEPTSLRNLFVVPATIDLAGAEIELVPAFSRELKLKRALEAVHDDFDFCLIDCPPSLGLITVNGLAAATEVVVPIQCEYYALEGLGQLLRNVSMVQGNLNPRLEVSAIILTMYDARTKLADQVANEVRSHFGAKVCRNIVPRTVRLSEAPSFGQPIIVFDPSSRGAIAYRELAKEVSGGAPQRIG